MFDRSIIISLWTLCCCIFILLSFLTYSYIDNKRNNGQNYFTIKSS